jgi:PilZ domain-containing protein
MTTIDSPQRPERRDIRYPLHLPVLVKLGHKEMKARSENISLGGILLSSAFLIPKGSMVEVVFGVAHLSNPGTQSSTRGNVLRVQPKTTGDFAVAIAFEHPFRAGLQAPDSGPNSEGAGPRFPQAKNRIVTSRGLHLTWAWHTET